MDRHAGHALCVYLMLLMLLGTVCPAYLVLYL